MPAVNVERIVERADASLRRAEAAHVARMREATNEAYRRLSAEIRRRWPDVLADAAGESRTFAEARARVLLGQLEALTRALEYGRPESGVPPLFRDMIVLGHETGLEATAELLTAYGQMGGAAGATGQLAAAQTAVIDVRAVDAALRNSQARLARHSTAAIARIEDAVVNAVVQGKGSGRITREIREIIRGDPESRTPAGGLHFRAETIARTELATAKADAARERYVEAGMELVQWYATLDERTCPWCGHRHGKVYPRDELVIPAHPRCRCYAAPFRPEFIDAGLVDVDYWRQSEAEIRRRVPTLRSGATPFEKRLERPYPRAVWTPSSGWAS